ncbi:MAG: VOC family protein [Thermoanaerobaculia bacterium]|nr:VOC family protein [Thermoanaerobaculia bacterium]
MANMEIEGIGQIHITVDDIDRAVAFYRDVLGLPLLFQVPEQSMAFFDCGGVRLYLGRAEADGLVSRPLLYYRVPDIGGAWERLQELDVPAVEPPHVVHRSAETELWLASVEDPEGTTICLMEERAVVDS